MTLNSVLESLSKELRLLSQSEKTNTLSQIAVEGLDAILLTLMDLAHDYNDMDMDLMSNMTSEDGRGLSSIRKSYLSAEKELDAENKAVLISATNHMDRLRSLFRIIGTNYQKLANAPAVA